MPKVKYSFLDVLNGDILLREFSEDASIDDVIASFDEIKDKKMLANNTQGIITDLRNVKFEINPSVFKKVSSYFKTNPEFYKYKLAAITILPMQVVLVTIANSITPKLRAKPFSTLKAAIAWVCGP
ncbi:hypothetical protein EO244_07445 [Ancylomarina salipaludis]|uniref:STAS/SEC14 domain-containing protein n=1 Tax=Ancylomarina salipaludis TaxID=2501299 RepID=A0A4Q1JMB9_9BACT|nr:hypothetical protein [Ancylomarina salipaludis]RXQ95688.1 hypothetical protein EO244_07445 [Ancylomarina salipaludis]